MGRFTIPDERDMPLASRGDRSLSPGRKLLTKPQGQWSLSRLEVLCSGVARLLGRKPWPEPLLKGGGE